MAPEQFDGRQDRKSDIYSFGVCLYQMAANGKLPFISRDIEGWIRAHRDAPVPPISSPIFQIVKRCLEKDPQNRYQSFAQLREDLQGLALKEGMGKIAAPEVKKLEGWEWCHKGSSLHDLGRYSEALSCYDKAINIDPDDAMSWYNKGNTLKHLGRLDEAISCYDKAISCYDKTRETEPTIWAWNNKAQALNKLQRYEEAIRCCDKAIEIDPRDFAPWWNKGDALFHLRRYDEALISYSKALELNQEYADLWNDKGAALECLGRREEAVRHYDEALKIDPNYSLAMNNRNNCLKKLGK
jgi:tetratricopeptide (TPR) repeat protein